MLFFRKLFQRNTKHINLSICGLDKAGKTAFVNYLMEGEFKETTPTMGLNRKFISFPKLDMHIIDLGGQEDFRPLWSNINEKSNALIYVVDSTDYFRFEETKEIFHKIINNQINSEIPVLILLNKADLPNRMERTRFIRDFNLLETESKITWAVFETSAKTGEGIWESMYWFVKILGGQ